MLPPGPADCQVESGWCAGAVSFVGSVVVSWSAVLSVAGCRTVGRSSPPGCTGADNTTGPVSSSNVSRRGGRSPGCGGSGRCGAYGGGGASTWSWCGRKPVTAPSRWVPVIVTPAYSPVHTGEESSVPRRRESRCACSTAYTISSTVQCLGKNVRDSVPEPSGPGSRTVSLVFVRSCPAYAASTEGRSSEPPVPVPPSSPYSAVSRTRPVMRGAGAGVWSAEACSGAKASSTVSPTVRRRRGQSTVVRSAPGARWSPRGPSTRPRTRPSSCPITSRPARRPQLASSCSTEPRCTRTVWSALAAESANSTRTWSRLPSGSRCPPL